MKICKYAITMLFLLALLVPAAQAADPVSVTILENGTERILVSYRFADYGERVIDIAGEPWSEILLGGESLMKVAGAL